MNFFLWVGIVFLVFVLVVVARDDLRLLAGPLVRTAGTVFDHRRVDDGDGQGYAAIIRFTAGDGRVIEFQDAYWTGAPTPPVGTKVGVVYVAHAPDKARVPRPIARALIYAFLLGTLTLLLLKLVGWLKG